MESCRIKGTSYNLQCDKELVMQTAANIGIASKRGGTLKLQQFASLYFSSGWTNTYLALVVIFNKIFSVSICSGQDSIKYPACCNTWPLPAIVSRRFQFDRPFHLVTKNIPSISFFSCKQFNSW